MVERIHQPLKSALRAYVNKHPQDWDVYVPFVAFALRTRKHSVTGKSPFSLVYGIEPRHPIDPKPPIDFMEPLNESELSTLYDQELDEHLNRLGLNRQEAYQRSNAQYQAMQDHQLDPAPAFNVQDWVKIKRQNPSSLEPRWDGPYIIIKQGLPGTYWLQDMMGKKLTSTISERNLAKWKDAGFEEGGSANTSA